jgi:hypothetical protein
MKRSEPPRAAGWLLGHLNNALAGDLEEEFARRGTAWYWRQVLGAVAGALLQRLRDEWLTIAFSFAWFFLGGESLARLNMRLFAWEREPWWIGFGWPWSLMAEIARDVVFDMLPLVLGLGVCLLLARRFRFRGFIAGIAAIVAGLIASNVAITCLIAYHLHLYGSLEPLADTLILLLALWIAQRGRLRVPESNHSNLAS